MMSEGAHKTEIEVTVMFPLADKPFHRELGATSTVGEVRSAAMEEFGAVEDPQYSYYLTHKGQRVDDSRTLREIDEHAHGLKFTLVKELIQG
jgi:hypothetical protein